MLYPTELKNKKVTTELTVDEIATMVAWYETLVFAECELVDHDHELVRKLNALTGNKLIFEQWRADD